MIVREGVEGVEGVEGTDGERGNAVVEFLGLALVLLLPVMYLVLTLGRVQAATFAVEGAARESARAFVTASSSADGAERAVVAVGLALADQGFDEADPGSALGVSCSAAGCLAPGGSVETVVRLDVPLPFVPGFVRDAVPLSVPVEARHVVDVDEYAARRP
ncbi:pilus assembly protein [Cellulosimicrobium marinum]|uniref:pilus assembly protein n=1 Tax=Cellulosimicrobium marinum TaxID=1638992 RepID=UPI001E4D1C3B|nr:pilus assembly protein [Cellulosimicrobium marinum]MCB7136444.1 pilus assembly protein [Cellulosimicrobium marinum]